MKKKGIPPTVGNFIAVLISKLTQHDQKLAGRERNVNIYRLGHLLNAAGRVEQEVLKGVASKDDVMTIELANKMISSMRTAFTTNNQGKFDLAPCRNVAKQLKDFIEQDKNPSLLG